MKYKSWDSSKRIEEQFLKSLNKLADMLKRIAKQSTSTDDFSSKCANFQNSEPFLKFIDISVRRMVTPLAVMNMRTWRDAAKKATKNPFMYRMLLKEIQEDHKKTIENQVYQNSLLIRTLPSDTADKVTKDIFDLGIQGMRASQIAKEITKYTDKHARASAKLIARTEVSKTMSAVTEARSKNLGIDWYVWRTAEDGDRVRPSHRNMNGVLVNFSDPPSPEALIGLPSVGNYHAGNIWNCRCYEEPLLEVDDVSWPHKVYYQGSIQTMTKTKFEQIM